MPGEINQKIINHTIDSILINLQSKIGVIEASASGSGGEDTGVARGPARNRGSPTPR